MLLGWGEVINGATHEWFYEQFLWSKKHATPKHPFELVQEIGQIMDNFRPYCGMKPHLNGERQKKSILEQLTGETSNLSRHAHLEKAKKRKQLNDEIRKLRIDLQHAQDRSTKSQNSVAFFTSGEMNLQQMSSSQRNFYLRVD